MTIRELIEELEALAASYGDETEVRAVHSDGDIFDVDTVEVDTNDDTVMNVIVS